MAMKCIHCGGSCHEVKNDEYECQFCGATFSKEELAPAFKKQSIQERKNNDSGVDVFDKNINGVLEIMAAGKKGSWAGSGYIISEKGFAITNAHVAADEDGQPCRKMVVRVCKQEIPATVVALADDKAGNGNGVDLALIKLAKMPVDAVALLFGDSDHLRNGEQIYVIGNSLGAGTCITGGILSDKNRNGLLMYDSATNPGNSGGPVFNSEGLVIGTHVAGTNPNGVKVQGMNYAIPSNIAQQFIEQVQRRAGIKL